ncbi:MAG: hypothetical protein COV67_03985 [Nitrospinae bacterium CG11_big_fil_rev_8_21_14_0_20_56_8]|nr:MAG: hypothetical protein COV67_03985 [Nitrospinae bacterium CG11_big_fil_rev_8_21_14_0_20_56_8]
MRKIMAILLVLAIWAAPAWAKAPREGDPAPDFSLESVDGKTYSLSQFKGKVVVIGMFHICVPCRNQALEFNATRDQIHSDQLVFLGINPSGDSRPDVEEYLKSFPQKVTFPYLLDPDQTVHKSYIQRDMPTVIIIGKDGTISARTPAVTVEDLVPFLKKLL